MKFALIDILPIILAAASIFGMKPVKPISGINEGYLSIEISKSLKGIFAISVMFHHLAQAVTTGVLFRSFSHIGYFCVGLFLFFTGYGLEKSYIKSSNYKNGFLLKRILPVFIPYILIMAVYFVIIAVFFPYVSPLKLVSDVLEASNSWYIICILAFYFAFWILMIICKKHYKAIIIGALIWFAAYVFICKLLNVGSWWYNAGILLIIGMLWALYERNIIDFIKRHYIFSCIVSLLMLIVTTVGRYKADKLIPIPDIKIISTSFSAIFFVVCILLFTMKVNIGNKALELLGGLSLEIYLIHGLFILLFKGNIFYIENDFLFILISVIGTILLAFLLNSALKPLIKKLRNTANRIS